MLRRTERVIVTTRALVLLVAVAACSSDRPTEPTDDGRQVFTTPPEEATAAAKEAIDEVVNRYYDALVRSQNEPSPSPVLFEGIATGRLVETDLGRASDYQKMGLRRVGEPVVRDPQIAVKGNSAEAVVCWDERQWGAETEEGPVDLPELKPAKHRLTLEKRDGSWLVTARTGAPGAC